VQRLIENPLALRLLAGDFLPGDTILVRVDEQATVEPRLKFEKAANAASAAAV